MRFKSRASTFYAPEAFHGSNIRSNGGSGKGLSSGHFPVETRAGRGPTAAVEKHARLHLFKSDINSEVTEMEC